MLISSVGAQLQWASSANCDFEFSLDGAGMRSLESHSTLEISGLEDGSHNISMRACQIGHMPRLCDAHPPTITWSVDTTAPSTRFVSAKDLMPLVVHRETVFAFGSSKDHVSFSCRLDGNDWESCGSRATFALSDGEHTLDVRAIDDTGNPDSTPLSHAFHVNSLETALAGGASWTYHWNGSAVAGSGWRSVDVSNIAHFPLFKRTDALARDALTRDPVHSPEPPGNMHA